MFMNDASWLCICAFMFLVYCWINDQNTGLPILQVTSTNCYLIYSLFEAKINILITVQTVFYLENNISCFNMIWLEAAFDHFNTKLYMYRLLQLLWPTKISSYCAKITTNKSLAIIEVISEFNYNIKFWIKIQNMLEH